MRVAQAPHVIGCEITVDVSRTVDCLRDAVDREVRKAEREARRAAEGELGKRLVLSLTSAAAPRR